jgi:hypothetical protein
MKIDINVKTATGIIEMVRLSLAEKESPETLENRLRVVYGITPITKCTGEAHSNPHIDNCCMCSPRWGFSGTRVNVKARWPKPKEDPPFDASRD